MSFFKKLFGRASQTTSQSQKNEEQNNLVEEPLKSQSEIIMNSVYWSFNMEDYSSKEAFSTAVQEYHSDLEFNDSKWNPDEVVIQAPEINVCYEAWVDGLQSLLKNEFLVDEDAFSDDNYEDGQYQVEIYAVLTASNGQYFTALDILYQISNQVKNKELGDHTFFEGLSLSKEKENNLPIYFLYCGS